MSSALGARPASDYRAAIQALMPRGAAWPRDLDTVQAALLSAFAASYAKSDQSARDLLVAAFPATATQLLAEWEQTLGLPDPALPAPTTDDARRALVVATLTDSGDMSIPSFVAAAAQFGITITVSTFRPFDVGRGVDWAIYGDEWAHTWRVNASGAVPVASDNPPTSSCVRREVPGVGDARLEAMLAAFAPAYTICIVRYI